ncbi:uncharacterized protein LOC117182305 isoform X2 [Belonocnema kinseyi]|uniref:uncharacterized protein LOC117182305 isoform X2 n=1 Tax=Belonocnema kinseyi TaxID=2817044 RepID=UPI00143CDC56|nr:uncharacterized protein LOC117182305 isoform X2 [Belonocnema kinseyi]
MLLPVLLLVFHAGYGLAQYDPNTTPVPILKQINRHNEDGSYSYGYEAADGSYKIESKHPNGEVFGKYGFVDDTGSIREVEYGASRRGFEPVGTGINVPPSTLSGNSIAGSNEPDDDGQYKEDPSIYYTDPRYTNGERYDPVPRPGYQPQKPQPLQPAQPAYEQQIAHRLPPARGKEANLSESNVKQIS